MNKQLEERIKALCFSPHGYDKEIYISECYDEIRELVQVALDEKDQRYVKELQTLQKKMIHGWDDDEVGDLITKYSH